MNRFYTTLLMTLLTVSVTFAQSVTEPGNNISKSITQMRIEFPQLRYIQTDEKGALYEDGYPQDGIAVFFYVKNNLVVEEFMIVQSADRFPRLWFDEMAKSLYNYSAAYSVNSFNSHHWCYSTFQIHLIYVSENGINTAMIVYEKGGYRTGISQQAFYDKYKSNR